MYNYKFYNKIMNDINIIELYDNVNYTLRIIGRIGFCLLIITLYRLYQLFASPLMISRNKKFINLFTIGLIFSFFLFGIEFIFPARWMTTISMSFNILTTFILIFYLHYQIHIINKIKAGNEFKKLSDAMDSLIESLKKQKEK